MPTLLEDLALAASAHNQRVADRLDAEARSLQGRPTTTGPDEQREFVRAARQAVDQAISRLPEAESLWREALTGLRDDPIGPHAEQLLRLIVQAFEASQHLVRSARELCDAVRRL